jgi:single-stranded DNA-binding protein
MGKVATQGTFIYYPEVRFTYTGIPMVAFAVNYRDKDGSENAISCHLFAKESEAYSDKTLEDWNVLSDLNEGDEVAVVGELHSRPYLTRDGKRQVTTYLVCDVMTFYGPNGQPMTIYGGPEIK